MSKSVLIIDTPESCDDCKILSPEGFCSPASRSAYERNEDLSRESRQDWCPLKEVPDKMAVENRWFSEDYAQGFNACIDEILKGSE